MPVEDRIQVMSNIRSIYEPRMDPSSKYFAVVSVDTGGFNEKIFVRVKEEPGAIHLNDLVKVEVDPQTSNTRLVSEHFDAELEYVEMGGIILSKEFARDMKDFYEGEENIWEQLLDESGAELR